MHFRTGVIAAFAFAFPALADQPVLRYIPKHEELKYTFGGVAPTHHIAPGTRIITWTEDCYDGSVTSPEQIPSKVGEPGHDNPQTGPFFIDGAEPGDTLAIHIEKLEPARDHGISSSFPGFGALSGTDRTAILGPDLPEKVWFYTVDKTKGVARTKSLDGRSSWEVPLAPFLGCLGVSPGQEVRSTIVPDFFGGNMDCPEVRAGNTVYLGVRVPGALLSFGDGHALQGDGEVTVTALETSLRGTVQIFVRKGKQIRWPRAETPTHFIAMGLHPDLDEAARMATREMIDFLVSEKGMSRDDAYILCSLAVDLRVTQLVDDTKGIHAMLPKSIVH